MYRQHNTTRSGGQWSEEIKLIVWQKGSVIQNYPPNQWRRDRCGNAMKWEDYGNRNSNYGWEIDHINPVANNGGDSLDNLQPLYWANNADKSDKLYWNCPVR
ncbi:MAG: HNH endonuclease signature motif containing protein [Flavobacteriales bacterium]